MAPRHHSFSIWTPCLLFLVLTSLARGANRLAEVPSSSKTSTNQRSPRSAAPSRSTGLKEVETETDGCCFDPGFNSDSEKRETEEIGDFAKLINSYSRRPYLAQPAPRQPLSSPLKEENPLYDNPHTDKRGTHNFNPSGWRRKRSVTREEDEVRSREPFQRLLRAVLSNYLALSRPAVVKDELSGEGGDDVLGTGDWGVDALKRSGLSRSGSRSRRPQRKPKRKPLEFNPTGW